MLFHLDGGIGGDVAPPSTVPTGKIYCFFHININIYLSFINDFLSLFSDGSRGGHAPEPSRAFKMMAASAVVCNNYYKKNRPPPLYQFKDPPLQFYEEEPMKCI